MLITDNSFQCFHLADLQKYIPVDRPIARRIVKIQLPDEVPPYIHIDQNDFLGRKQKKLKEEDISICGCIFNVTDPDSACGAGCLNVIISTECTPGCCPCGDYCKNQRFQKCEYAETKLFKTEGRGWGLLADETIKAGQFIIEYCGEIIPSDEAIKRSQAYEGQGLKDAYIISINANNFIDATAKGSLARFINHSCQPNCEMRKWNVLGEMRVGIFAKEAINVGTELTYDYNFEWYGGSNVRCLCGAPNCCKFLGAKSPGFQEHNHVWEEGDDRYTVEEIPLCDSAEDEPSFKLPDIGSSFGSGFLGSKKNDDSIETVFAAKTVVGGEKSFSKGPEKAFQAKNAKTSGVRSNSGGRNFQAGPGFASKKKPSAIPKRKKNIGGKPVDGKRAAQLFPSKVAQDEILQCEEIRNQAAANLNAVYDQIRPAIKEHNRYSQENVDIDAANKWISPYCAKLKADFSLSFSIVKNFMCPPLPQSASTSAEAKAANNPAASGEAKLSEVAEKESKLKN